ncbi:MAG: transglutaminase-like domain-containing protein [Rhodospirillaceae bacterium]
MMATAAIIWGLQVEIIIWGVLSGLLLEGGRRWHRHWRLNVQDWVRLIDLVILLIIGTLVVLALQDEENWFWHALRLLPLLCLPLPLSQILSEDKVCRLKLVGAVTTSGAAFDATYGYTILCIVAGVSAPLSDDRFLALTVGLIGWMLWSIRAPGWPVSRFMLAVLVAVIVTGVATLALRQAEAHLERWALDYFSDTGNLGTDSNRTTTALGSIGTIKLSRKIIARVDGDTVPPGGTRLRLAAYRHFALNSWWAGSDSERERTVNGTGTGASEFHLQPGEALERFKTLTITAWLARTRALLPLPDQVALIRSLSVSKMQVGYLGAVTASNLPSPVRYQAIIAERDKTDPPPSAEDLQIPQTEHTTFSSLASELQLSGNNYGNSVASIKQYLNNNYQYSLTQNEKIDSSALEYFVKTSHQGHCEYFASTTVLLLRAAGIPARYVIGYMVSERDPREGDYLVRQRDAHAWAEAFIHGRWEIVDTTPSQGDASQGATTGQTLSDLASWLSYRFWRWRSGETGRSLTAVLQWLLILAFLFLCWRLTATIRSRHGVKAPAVLVRAQKPAPQAPADDFALIERSLQGHGHVRPIYQPTRRWLESLSNPDINNHDELIALVDLHYRARFVPGGLADSEHREFARRIATWIKATRSP